jgi:hypothetical protein
LWWVALQDLIDELVILLSELKGNIRIVFWGITVLIESIRSYRVEGNARRTTWRASLATLLLATKDLHCGREAIRAGRKADRNTNGIVLDAIVAVRRRNGCNGIEDEVVKTLFSALIELSFDLVMAEL